jgi:EF-P beta-lysylation protein EpmB
MTQKNWQHNLRHALKNAKDCNDFFQTDAFEVQKFPLKIPLEFAKLIDKTRPNDPLLRQVVSQKESKKSGFIKMPLADESNSPVLGLIHKYPNRVLLIVSQVCAIHCRYCFRQNFSYSEHDAVSHWSTVLAYIQQDKCINEVIFSGGDPLSLSDKKLDKLISDIENISHIKTLRIHSRSAVVTPNRLTKSLIHRLNCSSLNIVMVLHTNHPNELSSDFKAIISALKVTLLNQSVLLKGVNDEVSVLSELSLALFELRILPYYLHMLDKVAGAQDYWVSDKEALGLHQSLKQRLSGYLVPRLVRDNDESSKAWLV